MASHVPCGHCRPSLDEASVKRTLHTVATVLSLVLLLQVVLAPVHCLAMAVQPAGLETVLCSPAGTERTILVGPDGHEVPPQKPGMGVCVVCSGLPQVILPEPPAAPAPSWVATGIAWFAASAAGLPPAARGPPYRPTGPPALS
jgi:hypothetical protein